MKDSEGPDLPQDAPLRVRVWWRCWRGWKPLLLMGVLGLAVASNPGVPKVLHEMGFGPQYALRMECPPATDYWLFTVGSRGESDLVYLGAFGIVWYLR